MKALIRRGFFFLLIGLVFVFLQSTLFRAIFPEYLIPNLMVIVVIFLGFYDATFFGLIMSFLLGIELDLSSGLYLGPWAGSFVVVFLGLALFSQHMFVESLFTVMVVTFIASLVSDIVYMIVIYNYHPLEFSVIYQFFSGAIITVILAPLIFNLLKFLFGTRNSNKSMYR